MEVIREKLTVSISPNAGETLLEELSKSYRPLIYSVRGDTRKTVGLNETGGVCLNLGEVFFTETDQMLFYKFSENMDAVEAGTLIFKDEGKQVFSGFKEKIRDAVVIRDTQKTVWETIKIESKRFEMLWDEAYKMHFNRQEIEASNIMKDNNLRNLLKKISSLGCCFQEDLMEDEHDYETTGMLNQLESLGLITKEFFVFCKNTGQQISRVNSLSALEDARAHGFKCFNCGRLISEEKISPQIKCSPQGIRFSKANYWLALHLISVLDHMKMDIRNIYYKTEKSNKVFDLFMKVLTGFFLFEIKDEPLKLEEIFMFLSRVNFYKPSRAILISSHMVPLDVRIYLKNYKGEIPITLIEGLDELQTYLSQCFQSKRDEYLENYFKDFNLFTKIDILEIFNELFFSKKMTEAPASTPQPVRIEVKTIAQEESYEKIEDFTEVIPDSGAEMEAVSPVTEEIPEVMTTLELKPEETMEIQLPDDEIESAVETLEDETVMDVAEDSQDQPQLEDMHKVDDMSSDDEIREDIKEEFAMDFMESIPTEILPIEDFPLEADTLEEDLEHIARELLNTVETQGVSGNYNRLEQELNRIDQIGSYGAVLIDNSGLPIINNLKGGLDAESIAAYSSIILDVIQNTLEESGLDKAHSIYIEGRSCRVKIFAGNNYCLAAHEERKTGEVEDESSALPGEIVLREAILKKVLENLSKADGIDGNVIAGRDGLIIESNACASVSADVLGYMTGMIVSENEKYLESLLEGPAKQIMIKTANVFFNLIPIENEAVLTSCLEPEVPRDVWQNKLPQAALMIKSALS